MNYNGRPKNMTAEERFWEKVDRRGADECWHWIGGRIKGGHGRFAVTSTRADVRLVLPHRFSWELHYGPIPDGLKVLHACDTPLCVNPGHLMIGTQQANVIDMYRKGRWPKRAA